MTDQPIDSAVLCYVRGSKAWFTTKPLADQWGDDWDDAPYEHNAGEPYGPCWHNHPQCRNDPTAKRGWKPGTKDPLAVGDVCQGKCCKDDWNPDGTPKWELCFAFYEGPFEEPSEGCGDSSWSVEAINRGDVAWLRPSPWQKPVRGRPIHAGVTYSEFCRLVEEAGGTVFEPRRTER